MKIKKFTLLVLSAATALGVIGCSKEDATAAKDKAVQETKAAADKVVDKVSTEAAKAKDAVVAAATDAKDATAKAVTDATAAAPQTGDAQSLLEQAQKFIAEKKYTDASNLLSGLSKFKLTPEQQEMGKKLLAQLQQAVGGEGATKAIGGLLGK